MADNSAPLDELTDKLEKLTAKLDNAHRRMREAMDDRDSRHAADMARIRIAWDALNAERSLWYARADRAEALNKETLEQNAKLLSERVMWENTAMQESRNRAYYVDLLNQIGQCLGDDSFIADDGTRSEEPLHAKLPKLVAAVVQDRAVVQPALLGLLGAAANLIDATNADSVEVDGDPAEVDEVYAATAALGAAITNVEDLAKTTRAKIRAEALEDAAKEYQRDADRFRPLADEGYGMQMDAVSQRESAALWLRERAQQELNTSEPVPVPVPEKPQGE